MIAACDIHTHPKTNKSQNPPIVVKKQLHDSIHDAVVPYKIHGRRYKPRLQRSRRYGDVPDGFQQGAQRVRKHPTGGGGPPRKGYQVPVKPMDGEICPPPFQLLVFRLNAIFLNHNSKNLFYVFKFLFIGVQFV